MIETMNSKMDNKYNNQQLNLKNKNKLRKQLEQEQNHRNGDHTEGYQQGGEKGRMGEKVQGIRSIKCQHKIDKGSLRIV